MWKGTYRSVLIEGVVIVGAVFVVWLVLSTIAVMVT